MPSALRRHPMPDAPARRPMARRPDGTVLPADRDVWGHPYTEGNTLRQTNRDGVETKACRHCKRNRRKANALGIGLAEFYDRHPGAAVMADA